MNGQPVLLGEVLYDCFEEDGSRTLGGAPFNVAWHLQGFGQNPVFISRVGDDDAGRNIRASMQQWGMDLSGLQLDTFHRERSAFDSRAANPASIFSATRPMTISTPTSFRHSSLR